MKKSKVVGWALLLSLLISNCSQENGDGSNSFDRGPILEHLADNIIIPAHEDLLSETTELVSRTMAFTTNPTIASLQVLKEQWLEARLSWKVCEAFTFGPIDARFLDKKMDLFPISEIGLNTAVSGYDGSDTYLEFIGSDKRGFGSIEYMLFGQSEEETITLFESNNRKGYLNLLSKDLNDIAAIVLDDWQNSYSSTFKANTGNDANASITLFTNDMIELIEIIKNFKVATPLGVRTNSDALPDLVESPHANVSIELILKNLEIIEDVFKGGNGQGLDDYLNALNITDDGELLSRRILDKIAECRTIASDIDLLQEAVINDKDKVQALLTATQQLTNLTKSDMMSQLGIIVTFSSNDGD